MLHNDLKICLLLTETTGEAPMLISGRVDDVLLGSTSISHKKSHIEDNSDIDIHYSHLNSFENDKPDMLQLIVDEQIKQFL